MAKIRKKKKSRKVLWAMAVLIALPVGFNLLTLTMTKRYTAEMRLMVDESSQSVQPTVGPFSSFDAQQLAQRPRTPQTQLDVLTGTIVLDNAVKMAQERMPEKLGSSANTAEAYDNLVRRLAVDNEPTSDILSVKVTEDDPELAAELANDIGLSYIDYSKKLSKLANDALSDQLKLKIEPLKARLTKIDAKIGEIKAKTHVYDVATAEANIGSTKELADRNLATAQSAYAGSQAQLVVAEDELKRVPQYIRSATHTQANPLMVSLQTSLAQERVALAQLRAQYQDNFPAVKEEKLKISDLEKQVKSAAKSIEAGEDMALNPLYQNMQSTVAQYRAAVQSAAGQLSAAKIEQTRSTSALKSIPEAEQQLQALIRDRTVTEQTYEQLEQRQSMAESNGAAAQPTNEVVSPALPPTSPSFPDHKLLTLAGMALGVFFAVLILMPRPELVIPEAAEPEPEPTYPSSNGSLPSRPAKPEKLTRALKRAQNAKALTAEEHEALAATPFHVERNEIPEEPEVVQPPLDPAQSLSKALQRANEAKPWTEEEVAGVDEPLVSEAEPKAPKQKRSLTSPFKRAKRATAADGAELA